jgi:hypothetical protein
MSGRLGRRRDGSQNTGMAAGVKPRSREAVRVFAQGFTRDDRPGEDEWWPRDSYWSIQPTQVRRKVAPDLLSESAIDFVANDAENAGRRGALSVPLLLFSPSKQCGDRGANVLAVSR